MFSGSIPALVTPFGADGRFEEAAYRDLIEWQIAEGSSALVPCGTTGESATLDFDEHFEVVRVCIDQAKGRVPIIAGCGSNDTRVAIRNVAKARELGADAGLLVPPYYNRPNQEGIFRHFEAIRAASDLPIVLYNVPARTVTDIHPDTVIRIASELSAIVGIKDATGDLARVSKHRAALGEGFCQLSGNDDLALAFLGVGGRGTISVTANAAPRLCADFHAAALGGDGSKALELHDRLFPLHAALFSDASPGPVKHALNCVRPSFPAALRLPMTEPSEASRKLVDAALTHAGLL